MRLCACQFNPYNKSGILKNIFEMKVAGFSYANRGALFQKQKIEKNGAGLWFPHEEWANNLVITTK